MRPRLDWDKGRALQFLLASLALDTPDVVAFYLGDDTTDEDAFAVQREDDVGILVADTPRPTGASYSLRDPEEVREFLQRLAGALRAR